MNTIQKIQELLSHLSLKNIECLWSRCENISSSNQKLKKKINFLPSMIVFFCYRRITFQKKKFHHNTRLIFQINAIGVKSIASYWLLTLMDFLADEFLVWNKLQFNVSYRLRAYSRGTAT